MGADGPGKAEVAVEELARARLFCDDWEQASHGGELTAGVAAGRVAREDVTTIGAVLAGDAEGRRDEAETTLFDSTGLAIQDLAIARLALLQVGRDGPAAPLALTSPPLRRRAAGRARTASSSGSRSPRSARATSRPHANPSTLP